MSEEYKKAIEILKDMRDDIYGAMQFEDDYQVSNLEEEQFHALNLAIKHLRKTKLIKNNYISKDKIREKIKKLEREKQLLEDKKVAGMMIYTPYQIVDSEILRLQELLKEN